MENRSTGLKSSLFVSVLDFEKRWIEHFEEIKKEIIAPSAFDFLQEKLRDEILELNEYIRTVSSIDNRWRIQQRFVQAIARVESYHGKAYSLSTSKWRDKHPGFLNILPVNFGKNINMLNLVSNLE